MFEYKFIDYFCHKKKFLLLTIVFILSRFIIFIIGIRPNMQFGYWQTLDPTLLKYDLINSLFYLHSEPVLWNLLLGIGLKLSPNNLDLLFFLFQIFLSYISLYYFYLILKIIQFPKKFILLILIFFIFSPNIIYYENWIFYSHLCFFLFFQISYFFLKYFEYYDFRYQVYVYISLLLLTLTWKLFHPILFLLFFLFFLFYSKKVNIKKFFLIFLLFFSLSLLPLIKNKIALGFFVNGSLLGLNLAQTTHPFLIHDFIDGNNKKIVCDFKSLEKNEEDFFNYFNKERSKLNHPSLTGNKSGMNNVGGIYRSKKCLSIVIQNILDNPETYLRSRIYNLVLSHSKLAIDHGFAPIGWNDFFPIKELKKNIKTKYLMGFFTISYIFFIYIYLVYYIFFFKELLKIKKHLCAIFFFYFYVVIIGHAANGWEQERFLYTGFIIQLLAIALLIKQIINERVKGG